MNSAIIISNEFFGYSPLAFDTCAKSRGQIWCGHDIHEFNRYCSKWKQWQCDSSRNTRNISIKLFYDIVLFNVWISCKCFLTLEWILCEFENEKSKRLCRLARTNDRILFAIDFSACRTTPHTSNIVILQLMEYDTLSICGRCGDCVDVTNEWISIDVCRQDSHGNRKFKLKTDRIFFPTTFTASNIVFCCDKSWLVVFQIQIIVKAIENEMLFPFQMIVYLHPNCT